MTLCKLLFNNNNNKYNSSVFITVYGSLLVITSLFSILTVLLFVISI